VERHAKPQKPEDLSPFERFREFARRIIAVPKAEIDKQEAEYKRARAESNADRAKQKSQ